jgi:hypothetical protein
MERIVMRVFIGGAKRSRFQVLCHSCLAEGSVSSRSMAPLADRRYHR